MCSFSLIRESSFCELKTFRKKTFRTIAFHMVSYKKNVVYLTLINSMLKAYFRETIQSK